MDFFQFQEDARRRSGLLVGCYLAAMALIITAVYAAFTLVLYFALSGEQDHASTVRWTWWNPELFLGVTGITLLIVLAGTAYKIVQLSRGGAAVATMLGGREVRPDTNDPNERKLRHVVEEMAIASGTPVPEIYVLDQEPGINAFAAGFKTGDAVVAVTRGAITHLDRGELQGVIGHEFSHILNGDMRLNLRLTGVLHGILVIGLIGVFILRSLVFARGRSRKDARVIMAAAVAGATLAAIGFIGVFFGRIIKSAISRQREHLADSSAIQFTRNPDGLAGALKKIGGASYGSRVDHAHAEEASHFFFANGLSSRMAGLLSTHPPLAERIRKIDPSFDGVFPEVQVESAPSYVEGVSGLAGEIAQEKQRAKLAVAPAAMVYGVGTPRPEHVEYARELIASLPESLSAAAREPFGARAVLYALLLNDESGARDKQMDRLARHADPAVFEETRRLADAAASLEAEHRLPLADLAIASLKELSPAQFRDFRDNIRHLIHADEAVDLFEYTLSRMILRHLKPKFEKVEKRTVKWHGIRPLLPDIAALLSCLACWGADSREDAEAAFETAAGQLKEDGLDMAAPDQCGLDPLDRALDRLRLAAPPIKKRVLAACIACVAADGTVTHEEAELLRAVADSLECPVPPLLPGESLNGAG
ncbi:M48 family metallopeptidase [Kiritimatiella glycovorans]|uniref:Putative protease HtpX n=1 Tax=Kiritimatiella glycovorans TaxID=1307763 RepID=A0A0G3EJZ9_9BACT|nr:M48 family metallopeptidase [Kiritimatiella glycovorans]AKJ64459.1 putative protease HtpX [Kiritimatiella glycovorans]